MYIKSDEFVNICYENNCDPKQVQAAIQALGKTANITHIRNRIANYRRKGLLPLESGNKVSAGEFLTGSSTLYAADGTIKQQWVKTDAKLQDNLEAFKSALESMAERIPPAAPSVAHTHTEDMKDLITFYPIGDAHIGMLAHHSEAGEDHDLKISRSRLTTGMSLIVDRAMPTEEAFILDVGDYLHADDSSNTTPRGNNPLDVDGRFYKVLDTALEIAVTMIDTALTKHSTVHWRSAHGNHNPQTSLMINIYLRGYYRNDDNVIIHDSPAAVDYFQFGKCLFGFTHGHTIKADKLGEVMAVDCQSQWSSTKHRYFLTGHVHHQSVKEYPTCVVETFRTLASKDAWHASMGYRSGQDIKAITYHKEYGEVNRSTINIALIS